MRLAPIWMLKAIVPFIGPIRRRISAINGLTADALYTIDSRLEVDTSKARRVLGFDPRPPTESIRDALEWWAARGMLGQT